MSHRSLVGWMIAGLLAPAAGAAQQLAPADSAHWAGPVAVRQVSSELAADGGCLEVLLLGRQAAVLRSYYPSGHLREYQAFADWGADLRHGSSSTWYDNGQLCALEPYERGVRQGTLLLYYENGALKRRSDYEAGQERPGQCFDPAGQPLPFVPYEQPPLYPGGAARLAAEVRYLARKARVISPMPLYMAGYVQLSFVVSTAGELMRPRIEVASSLPAFDQAALQALNRLTSTWQPGYRDGQPVAYHYRLRLPVAGSYSRALLRAR